MHTESFRLEGTVEIHLVPSGLESRDSTSLLVHSPDSLAVLKGSPSSPAGGSPTPIRGISPGPQELRHCLPLTRYVCTI